MDWIKQFTDMIFTLNRDQLNIEGAYILKEQHLPKSIFKYREVNENSLKNLEEDTVWLADPKNFNDPYDCAHTVDNELLDDHWSPEFFAKFMEEKADSLNLTQEQNRQLELSKNPVNELIDILLSREPAEKRGDLKSVISAAKKKIHEDLSIANSKAMRSSFKLCSFSERNDSMLMWAHYASYHQGFCIEYNLENIPYPDYRRRFLYPTIYSDEMFDATDHFMKDIEDESFNNLHLSLAGMVKAKDWEYEKEWRLIFANGIFDKERAYEIGKPEMVYLGTKINQENQNTLIEICNRRGIPISKMKAHHSKFKLVPTSVEDAEQHFFKEKA